MEYPSSSASYRSTCLSRYDVFLSFRGEDTGGGFTDNLYKALERREICTIKDDNETKKVTNISSELFAAIEVSRVAVVVVSENYTSSRRCLEKLVKIFECKEQMGMKIMPIFYKVDPSDLRNQGGSFDEAFFKHEAKSDEDSWKVLQWRNALFEIANLKAWVLNDRSHESEIIEDICEAILRIIKPTLTLIEKGQLIGLSSKLDQLSSLLNPNSDENVNVMVVGIHGMGGIGKTTIARALYERIRNEFEADYFLSNVGEEFEISRIIYLQGTFSKNKKILLVLDDVYSSYQTRKLILDSWGFGSRIIITTRDANLLSTLGVKKMFKMEELEHEEALQLFSLNAFKERSPKEGYLKHSKRIVKLVGGNPLALRTLGSSLQNKDLSVWNNVIERLQGNFKWLGQPSVEEEDKEPILQRYSSLESGLSCLDGLTEVQKLKIEEMLLFYQKRFKSSCDSDEITFTDYDTFIFKNTTRDHFCLLQGDEGRSYIDLMEKLLRLRNQLMPTERVDEILQRKCSKNKEDVLHKIATKELEYAEKVYLISRRRFLRSKASTNGKSSDEDLLKHMIRRRKEIMKLEAEYFGLLQAGATFFDHKLSRCSEDVLQRAVCSKREFLGLEKLYTDARIGDRTWSMFDVQPSYFERAREVTNEMVSLWEEQEMYPNLAHDSNIDYKINRLERIVSLRSEYLELEDKYLWKLLEKYAKNHDNTSTSFDVRQIHLEYVWEYVFEMILRWRTDLTLFEDIHACQLKERGCSEKSAHEFAKSIEELKEVEKEYCQLIRGRHVTILDSISSMDVTQIYTKYNDLELLNHIESQKKKVRMLQSDCLEMLKKYVSVDVDSDSQRLRIATRRMGLQEIEDQYFRHLNNGAAKRFVQQASLKTKGAEESYEESSIITVPTDEIITIVQPSIRVRRWEIQRSIVLGGLIESITSLVIITAATSANISDGNIVALALTNLITGLFVIRHEVSRLQKKNQMEKRCNRIQVEGSHYKELLKEKMYYLLYFIIAFLSFLLFGLVPPLVYALSSLKTRNKNLKIIATAGASLSCTAFLAIQKAHIQKPKNSLVYVKIAAIYLAISVGAFSISYLAGYMFGHLLEKLPLVL